MPDVMILNPWDSQGNRITDSDGVFQCVRGGKSSGYPQGYILHRINCPKDNVRCLNPWDGQTIRTYDAEGVWHTLYANSDKSGQMRDSVVYAIDQQGGKGNASCAVDVMPSILSDSHGTPHGVAYAVQMDGRSKADTICEQAPTLTVPDKQSKVMAVVTENLVEGGGGNV